MRGRTALTLAIFAAVIFLVSSCTTNTYQSQDMESSVTATAQPTPEPTAPTPVTRQDISSYYLPGLSEIGVIPEGKYKIGIIARAADGDDAWWEELLMICGAYEDKFAIEITAEIADDAQSQIDTADDMIAGGIDFLILSPYESGALSEVGDLCEGQGIPYITINDSIDKTPGEDGYVCTIIEDDYMIGVLTGISIVEAMTEKYGQPAGNIGEITGVVSDEASILRSLGIRRVFARYENLNVVCSMAGDYDEETSYKAAVNVLKAFREGELDGIITVNDDTGVQALQAVLDYDRSEMTGSIWSMGATKSGLTCVWYGDFAQTVECTTQTGMAALEYALQYLEGQGDGIPPVVASVTRVFRADTSAQADAIAVFIAEMDSKGTALCFENIGEYDLFLPDIESLGDYYPLHYYEYDDIDAYLSELEPYTTGEAAYSLEEQTE
ncbi:MAG: substrate-binding domain-containing protein [Eubacteriales bacterium]|nr:substrate-binding domain-containing protein [Eubacteriales bacterium]